MCSITLSIIPLSKLKESQVLEETNPKQVLEEYKADFLELDAEFDYDIEEKERYSDNVSMAICCEKSVLSDCLRLIEEICNTIDATFDIKLEVMEEKLSASEKESRYSMNLDHYLYTN